MMFSVGQHNTTQTSTAFIFSPDSCFQGLVSLRNRSTDSKCVITYISVHVEFYFRILEHIDVSTTLRGEGLEED